MVILDNIKKFTDKYSYLLNSKRCRTLRCNLQYLRRRKIVFDNWDALSKNQQNKSIVKPIYSIAIECCLLIHWKNFPDDLRTGPWSTVKSHYFYDQPRSRLIESSRAFGQFSLIWYKLVKRPWETHFFLRRFKMHNILVPNKLRDEVIECNSVITVWNTWHA